MRRLSVSNLNAQRFKFMPFLGEWRKILGDQERKGCWIIYGKEKNGKSTFALNLAKDLSKIEPVLYISAEEGTGYSYTASVNRVGIQPTNRNFHSWPFVTLEELKEEMRTNRKCERIIFLDNLTIYTDLKKEDIIALTQEFPRTLFIFIAHEDERSEPLGAAAVMAKQLAYVIFHVTGLAAFATVRTGRSSRIDIDEETASLIHGDKEDLSQTISQNQRYDNEKASVQKP